MQSVMPGAPSAMYKGKKIHSPQSEPTEIVPYCPKRSVKFDVFYTCSLPWVLAPLQK